MRLNDPDREAANARPGVWNQNQQEPGPTGSRAADTPTLHVGECSKDRTQFSPGQAGPERRDLDRDPEGQRRKIVSRCPERSDTSEGMKRRPLGPGLLPGGAAVYYLHTFPVY